MVHIDFHVHTSERSSCATATQDEQIQAAIHSDLNAIAITDHARLVPETELARLNQVYAPFRIFSGIEINADGEDWLVIGLREKKLETEKWVYPQLHEFVMAKNAIIILAHPFRFHPNINVNLVQYPPHAVELRSNNIRVDLVPKIRELALQHKLPTLCNSDSHNTSTIGKFYNIFDRADWEDADVFEAIKLGLMTPSIT